MQRASSGVREVSGSNPDREQTFIPEKAFAEQIKKVERKDPKGSLFREYYIQLFLLLLLRLYLTAALAAITSSANQSMVADRASSNKTDPPALFVTGK